MLNMKALQEAHNLDNMQSMSYSTQQPSNRLLEEAIASTTRAIASDKHVKVAFQKINTTNETVDYEKKAVTLPALSEGLLPSQLQRLRGEADAAALALRYHDEALHHTNRPKGSMTGSLYDIAEDMRVEALGARNFKGVADNLTVRLEYHCKQQGLDTVIDEKDVPVAEIVGLLIRKALTGRDIPHAAENTMKQWGNAIATQIAEDLAQLPEHIQNQAAYSQAVHHLINHLKLLEQWAGGDDEQDIDHKTAPDTSEADKDDANQDGANFGGMQTVAEGMQKATASSKPAAHSATEIDIEGEGGDDGDDNRSPFYPSPQDHNLPQPYTAYTTEFDEIVRAETLCSPEELHRLRIQLDTKLSMLKHVTNRMANRLQRLLLSQQVRSLHLHQEEGILDAGKLAQIIADPFYPLGYKWESTHEDYNTVVTLLLDNSGSMRGRPITVAAMSADLLARTLERCGIKVEILGFTSRDWKGGNSKKRWHEHGSPPNPGRLNDLRHIIYKSADQPWRRTRKNLGLMLREGILKENIDGEAVLWAYNRLMARPEDRRILMVISDGAPVDDSTLSVNSSDYLENHLKEVIHWIENSTPVELLAIGIGHDVTRYYKHAVTIREVEQLSDVMFRELAELLSV